jgi:hypothetical protein
MKAASIPGRTLSTCPCRCSPRSSGARALEVDLGDLSSSSTATRCSLTSTEISSSRLAGGSGGRRGGVRRRVCCAACAGPGGARDATRPSWRPASRRQSRPWPRSRRAGAGCGALATAPPRLPRAALLLGGIGCAPGSAGGAITVSVGAGVGASWVRPRSSVGGFCRRNHRSKWILLVGRARFPVPESGGARAAMWSNSSA